MDLQTLTPNQGENDCNIPRKIGEIKIKIAWEDEIIKLNHQLWNINQPQSKQIKIVN